MKEVRISLLGLALMASAAVGFAQKTKIVTKQCLDSILIRDSGNPNDKYSYSYDDKGNNTERVEYHRVNPSSNWNKSRKYEYTFDNKGNQTAMTYYYVSKGEWEESERYEYRYDDKKNITEMFIYAYYCDAYGCGWKLRSYVRYEHTYNAEGNITETNIYAGGGIAGKYEYMYNEKGNLTLKLTYGFQGELYVRSKEEYTYDEKGNKIKYRYEEGDKNKWREYTIIEYNSYDSLGNYTEYFLDDWKFSGEYRYTYEYTYNLSYSNTDLLLPCERYLPTATVNDYPYNGMIIEKKQLNGYPNPTTYHWSAKEIEVEDDEEDDTGIVSATLNNQLWVYPNPAKNQLTIECRDAMHCVSTVEVYSVVGQNVGAGFKPTPTMDNTLTIDISHLPNGIYFLKMDNKVVKFIKE